ncbi:MULTISPECIES: dihydrolipoyllysine-residue acetyltransferase [unclassified Pseudomonas]|uniref:dihydrolipoyllysine-residue acetyltransferase n=1 Tax=unclassified Pseudomonas TaxID=196821 RepID=UPI000BA3171E|nr:MULTISPECIES: dihydrolipoyllysine-residue acetyltransferase [unclassified Pseudomonas]MCU1734229.1 dihydrolipoyllysine-residue acetyltransferase [Pseudomonas sp. 20P_3.2_Bac4]MCU1743124.1 dihydrolipoyllysine-residue acetyltransferase [Pseudomonas sp. 20P_3.2_Bac5]
MSEIREIQVPDIGDFKDLPVIDVLVKPGDTVAFDDPLLTLESDKASMDVPSPAAGTVVSISLKVGDRVSRGSAMLTLQMAANEAPVAPASSAPAVPAPAPVAAIPAAPVAPVAAVPAPAVTTLGVKPHASPSVRGYARKLGVDVTRVAATGKGGRILREDVERFIKDALVRLESAVASGSSGGGSGLDLLPWPNVDFSRFGAIEKVALSRIKKISGANLARNWVMIPHVTNNEEADITGLEAFRVQLNAEGGKEAIKYTLLAFLIKAAVATLKAFPQFNSSLGNEDGEPVLVLKHYYHIGFAADTPNGLVVPVIRDADQKGIGQIAVECGELARKARDGKLGPADMTGGTFTVSSLGGIGGTGFSPIINAPEVAILGVTRSQMKPVWDGSGFAPRLILPMALSWDHRVVDGAAAARFLQHLAALLADFRRITL